MPEPRSAAGVLAERLREKLLSGEFPPGARLKEEELAERFRAGRYTVRSALRTLVAARLLEHEPNRGARVPILHAEQVDKLYEYRTVLEVGSLRVAQARDVESRSATLRAVENTTAALVALPDDAPWPQVVAAHQEIHRAIVGSSGNARLIEAYSVCEEELQFVVASTRPSYPARRLAALHVELLARLREGSEAAVAALERDIDTGRGAVLDAMAQRASTAG